MAYTAVRMSNRRTASLLESRETWVNDPAAAFRELLATDWKRSTRRRGEEGDPAAVDDAQPVSAASERVLSAMFGKFLSFLAAQDTPFVKATTSQIETFLLGLTAKGRAGEEPRSQSDIAWRYARMLQRIYDRAIEHEAVSVNPATDLLAHKRVSNPGRKRADTFSMDRAERLLNWLGQQTHLQVRLATASLGELDEEGGIPLGALAPNDGATFTTRTPWRVARDLCIATLCLGAGLRSAEIIKLQLKQIEVSSDEDPSTQCKILIPVKHTVDTSKMHESYLHPAGMRALTAWMAYRRGAMLKQLRDKNSQVMFPAGADAQPLTAATLLLGLRSVCDLAMLQGVLQESDAWVLEDGSRGLRRAYIMSNLAARQAPEVLTVRLGHWKHKSIQHYEADLPS